jgi:hypothetical protein
MHMRSPFSTWLSVSILVTAGLVAQPSGGPYGPIRQSYPEPRVDGKIFYVAVDGSAEANGSSLSKPTTLEAAIERARTGDAIVLRGGTYRTGGLIVNQGITIQPHQDEQPILKGTLVATEWQDLGNGLWTTQWKRLFPQKPADWWRRHREGKITPLHRFNNDMVFVDGRFLQSAGWEGEVDANSYHIDYETGTVYIGVDPKDRLVEITAYDVAILRTTKDVRGVPSDRKGYTLRGITLTQYAYRALEIEGTEPEGISPESKHGKEVVGTTIEHCTISYCSRVAGYVRGDRMTIRNCRISDTSTEGLYVIASNDVLLERNVLLRNNIEGITGYYPAAVKIFNQCYRVTCNDNLVMEQPNSNGIWYDVGNVDGVFTNNWIEGVGRTDRPKRTDQVWPSDNGFFFEISKGAVCAGNVFVNCDQGILILNSSDVQVYQNTFVNSIAAFARDGRGMQADHFGWHPTTGPDVDHREGHVFVNNLVTGDVRFARPVLFVWQPPTLCERLPNSMFRSMAGNGLVRASLTDAPLVVWGPAPGAGACQASFRTSDEARLVTPALVSGLQWFDRHDGPLFVGPELRRFDVVRAFAGRTKAAEIPAAVMKRLSNGGKGGYIGAYPPHR